MDDSAAAASAAAASAAVTLEPATTLSPLRRRHSISTSVVVPKQLTIPATPRQRSSSHTPPPDDVTPAPISLKSSSFVCYTSLKDLLPSTSPNSGSEIYIRNRLVKQAAWAYLQPKSVSPTGPSGPCFLEPLTACLNFFCHHLLPGITRILHRMLRALRGQLSS